MIPLQAKLLGLARAVQRRQVLVGAWRNLTTTAWLPPVFLLAAWLALALAARPRPLLPVALGALALWLLLGLTRAWLARPGPVRALACYDAATAGQEQLVSAWSFLQEPDPDAGRQAHLHRIAGLLPDLPAPAALWSLRGGAWPLAALLALVLACLPLPQPPPPAGSQDVVDAAARERAAAAAAAATQAAAQTRADADGEALAGLLDAVAAAMKEVDLDRRAYLAGIAGALDQLDAALDRLGMEFSPDLARALLQHVDTAALGEALAAQDPEAAAQALRDLAAKLEGDPTAAEQQRLLRALQKALADAGADTDHLAQQLAEVAKRLADGQRSEAAALLRRMGGEAQELARRRALEQRLRGVAKDLRAREQELFRAGGAAGGAEWDALARRSLLPRVSAAGGAAGGAWAGPAGVGEGTAVMGEGELVPGGVDGMTLAPIPGLAPLAGEAPPPPPPPVPGQQPGGERGDRRGGGGTEAGDGTEALWGGAAPELPPSGTLSVAPAVAGGAAPAVTSRQVEGSEPGPGADPASGARPAAVALAAITQAEQALAEETLPLARREQLLRYFTALRRALDDEQP